MVAPIRYLSRREISKELGVTDYSEDRKTLEVIGKVGIGTTVFDVDPGAKLQVNGAIFMAGDASQGGDGKTGIEIGAGGGGIGTAHHRIRSAGGSGQNLMFEAQTADVFTPGGDIVFKTGGTGDRLRILKDGNIGIGVRTPTAKLTINPLTTLPVDGTVTPTSTIQKAIGGVSIANSENKIYPSSNFNATLGLYQENEIGGITTYVSGNQFIYGSRNVLVKRNDNTQDIRALNFTGSETLVTWTDQNTANQIIGERSTIEYLGADANGRTSSYLAADNVFLRPADGATQTINNVVASNNVIINPKAGINTVNITNLLGVRPALPYVFNFGSGTHDINITDLVIYDTINDWGTIGSVGTLTVDIDNYYGLRLLEPTDTSDLTFNNNYGVYSGWSESKNYFAGDVGIGSDNPTAKLDVAGITKTEQLNVTGVSTFQGNINLGDDKKLIFGNDDDFEIYHDGSGTGPAATANNTYFKDNNANGGTIFLTKHFIGRNAADTETTFDAIENGGVRLFFDGSKKFETTSSGIDVTGHTETDTLNVSGISTFQGNVDLGDDNRLRLGDSEDLQIYHDGSNSYVSDQGTGDLRLSGNVVKFNNQANTATMIKATQGSSVELNFNNSKKFETTGYGVTVFGTTQTQQLNVSGLSTFQGDVRITDDDKLRFGTSSGGILQIYTNGTNSFFKQTSGDLKYELADQFIVQKDSGDEPIAIFNSDSDVELYHDGSKKFETTGYGVTVFGTTQTQQLNVTGVSTFQGNINLGDNDQIIIGDGPDLKLYHDGSNSYVEDTGVGALIMKGSTIRFRSTTNENIINASQNGSVDLYYDNSKKFETTASGIDVTGHTETDTLRVSGVSTFQGNVDLGNGDKINLGDGQDLQIFHDGSNNYILGSNGDIVLKNPSSDYFRAFSSTGAVQINYDGNKKFETTGTGVSISNGNSDTATIAAPSNLIIDPAVVGDNTGIVRIKGDLFVDGTTTQINSTTLEIADFIVGIASTATTDLLADGAGIQIGPDNTLLYEHNGGTNPSLKSSENLNVASGKGYQINQTEVLNATTLGSGVTNSSLTSVGTLSSLNVSGVSTFQSHVHLGDDDELRFGASNDFKIVHDPNDCRFENSNGDIKFKNTGSYFFFDEDGGETLASFINDGAVNLFHDNSKKFETTSFGVKSTGNIDLTSELNFTGASNKYIDFFTDNDSGSTYAANLRLVNNAANSFHTAVKMHRGGAVELYHNNSKKFETTGYGVTVFGTTQTQQLNVSGLSTFQGNVTFSDSVRANFGNDEDLRIVHIANQNWIQNYTGDFNIQQFADDSDITFRSDDGSGGVTEYININGSTGEVQLYHYGTEKIKTTGAGVTVFGTTETQQLNVSGVSTFQSDVHFGDDDKIILGDGDDLQIYHDGSNSYISDQGTGELRILTNQFRINNVPNNGTSASFNVNGSVDLHYNGVKKFETIASGIDVTGHTETDTLRVSGVSTFQDDVSIADKIVHTGDTDTAIRFPTGDTFAVETNGKERLRVSSNGRVGIGTDNLTATALLNVYGATNPYILVEDGSPINNQSRINFKSPGYEWATGLHGGDNGKFKISYNPTHGSNDYLTITTTGAVGIGTDEPGQKLHIVGDGSPVILLEDGDGTDQTFMRFKSSAHDWSMGADHQDGSFVINKATNLRTGRPELYISSAGDVGIGTTNPNSEVKSNNNRIFHAGIVTSRFYYGDGSNLTGISAGQVGALTDIIFDTTPQLGGNLDLNGKDITGTGNIDITGDLNVSGVSTFTDTTNHSFIRITRTNNSNALSLVNTSTANGAYVDQRFVIDEFSRAGIRGQIDGGNLGGKLKFYTAANTQVLTQRAVIDQEGRFGINVNSPTETLDVGGTTQTEQLNVSGVSTFSDVVDINAGLQVGNVRINNSNNNEIDTSFGNLILDPNSGVVEIQDSATVGDNLTVTGNLDVDGHTELDNVNVSGVSTFADDVTIISGNVGIATTNPTSTLHISGVGSTVNVGISTVELMVPNGAPKVRIGTHHWDEIFSTFHTKDVTSEFWIEQNSDNNDGPDMVFFKSRGVPGAELPVQIGDNLARMGVRGLSTSTTASGVGITLTDYPATASGLEWYVDHISASGVPSASFNVLGRGSRRLTVASDGKVGIGTTLPQTSLHIHQNSPIIRLTDKNQSTDNRSWNIAANASQVLRIQAINDAGSGGGQAFDFYRSGTQVQRFLGRNGGSYWFAIDNSSRRVGIGTTVPEVPLDIRNTQPTLRLYDTDATNAYTNITNINGNMYLGARNNSSNGTLLFGGYGGGTFTEFFRASSNGFIVRTNGDERLRVASTGNVGVGTTIPEYKLHVEGDIKLADTGTLWFSDTTDSVEKIEATASTINLHADSEVRFFESDTGTEKVSVDVNNSRIFFNGDDNTYWHRPASDTHAFVTAGSERVRITSDGNVGVGITDPTALLHVQNDSVSDTKIIIESTGTDSYPALRIKNDARSYDLGIDGATDALRFYDVTGSAERLRITSGGAVQISGADDQDNLVVKGGSTTFVVHQDDSDGEVSLRAEDNSGNNYTKYMTFFTEDGSGPTERVRITSAGNVGIGTDNPTTKLEIAGTGSPTIRIRDLDGSQTYGQILSNSGTFVIESRNDTSTGRIMFRGRDASGTNEYARFNSNGDLGIGTISPSSAADTNNTAILNVGVVTANFYYGNGSNLTGLTAGIVGALAGLTIRKEGSAQGGIGSVGDINFVSSNLSATASGVGATITLSDTPSFTKIGIGTDVLDASLQINVGSAVTALDIQGSEGQLFSVTNNLTSGSIFSVNDVSGIPSIDVDANGTILLAPYGINENVGVGTTNPSEKLDVIGTVKATDFNTTSDQNLKTNIHKIENPLEKVVEIRGVNFEWKQNNKSSVGVIAQEVEKVLPELVTDSGTKTVNYNGLIGLLIEVVKEQQEQINSLNSRLSKLE